MHLRSGPISRPTEGKMLRRKRMALIEGYGVGLTHPSRQEARKVASLQMAKWKFWDDRTVGFFNIFKDFGMSKVNSVKNVRNFNITTVKNYLYNNFGRDVFMVVYWCINIFLFCQEFYVIYNNPGVQRILGIPACFSRASASVIKFNCALILIPVLRNLLTWLRGTFVNNYIPIDKNIEFHKYCAFVMLIFSGVHVWFHYVNMYNISITPADRLNQYLGTEFPFTPPIWFLLFLSLFGFTGHLALVILFLMYSSAVAAVRRRHFEVFWYTHHLFLLFYILVAVHGFMMILAFPTFWLWTSVPLGAYLLERLLRIIRGQQDTILHLVRLHPSGVCELQFKNSSFKYRAGQYLFINIPTISKHEYHPITITSAPEEEYISIHVKMVGDWSKAIGQLFNPTRKPVVMIDKILAPDGFTKMVRIDGPYGSSSDDVFNFEVAILVGAGIGVTPFASILKHIKYRQEASVNTIAGRTFLRKIYFYWICRDKKEFDWFSELLHQIEEADVDNKFSLNCYLTGALKIDDIRVIAKTADDVEDTLTGLESKTTYGRPRFDKIFENIAAAHSGKDVGVFFCGNPAIAAQLSNVSRKYSSVTDTRFIFHKENF
jgi:predicted ferric reductase